MAIYVFETRGEIQFHQHSHRWAWEKFCKLFELDDLWADETIRANNARVQARERILPRIPRVDFGVHPRELIARLEGTGLPFAPIARPQDMFDDPHLNASGVATGDADRRHTDCPSGAADHVGWAPPACRIDTAGPGADTRAVLAGLGYAPEWIDALLAGGAAG